MSKEVQNLDGKTATLPDERSKRPTFIQYLTEKFKNFNLEWSVKSRWECRHPPPPSRQEKPVAFNIRKIFNFVVFFAINKHACVMKIDQLLRQRF